MQSLNHIHTLFKIPKGQPFANQWKCADPHCMFRAPLHVVKRKATRCNVCGEETVMDYKNWKRAKPVCKLHENTKESKRLKEIQEKVASLDFDALLNQVKENPNAEVE